MNAYVMPKIKADSDGSFLKLVVSSENLDLVSVVQIWVKDLKLAEELLKGENFVPWTILDIETEYLR